MDALSADEAEALETHVATCARCAEALCREARLEEHLHHLGAERGREQESLRPGSRGDLAIAGAVLLAAAAGVALWLRPVPGPVNVAQSQLTHHVPPLAVCERRADLCDDPERHGIATVGTAGLEVPRYEEGPPLMSWRAQNQPEPKRSSE